MDLFVRKHQEKINATLGCFDRMLFRGYLPIQAGWAMAEFLNQKNIRFRNLKDFLLENAYRVNDYAKAMAQKTGRRFQYLTSPARKEELARKMVEEGAIEQGLVCIFSVLEPCRSFSFQFAKGRPFIQSAKRKCLFLYFYFMDRGLGLIHVKLQTWFPMSIQVYVNGHEWLARKLTSNHIRFSKRDNVFVWIEDCKRAQKFADRFVSLNWPRILERYARCVNPLWNDMYIIVHDVDELEPGAYVLHRGPWGLELLKRGEFRRITGRLGLAQDLPADCSAAVLFLADLNPILDGFGNRGYRATQLEAGIIGGRPYLAAYAQRLGATGLTFYDDEVTEFFSPHAFGKSAIFLVALGHSEKVRVL
jgi:hypothetical protein